MALTLEEAGELVLSSKPWMKCGGCQGSGSEARSIDDGVRITEGTIAPVGSCGFCLGAGYLLQGDAEKVYEMLGIPIPPKPLTGRERIIKLAGDFLKKELNTKSAVYDLFQIERLLDEEEKKIDDD